MRVAIVNDQLLATEALRRVVASDPAHEIAWFAKDGTEAVEKCARDIPDVILMDLLMPNMDGAEATRLIMTQAPCPILVVTAGVAGNFALVCKAMGYGAYDAVNTPVLGSDSPAKAGAELLSKLMRVDTVNRRLKEKSREPGSTSGTFRLKQAVESTRSADESGIRLAAVKPRAEESFSATTLPPVVLIGASTGGPPALEILLKQWPADFAACVVIAQHIGQEFVTEMVSWLTACTSLKVKLAANGDAPQAGTVLIANSVQHLTLRRGGTLGETAEPVACPYRPSIDVLFQSFAQHWSQPSVAALLTGMGDDGAQGLLALKNAGWHTIAQDKLTSTVYGMPRAAAELGAASRVLPLSQIAGHIEDVVRRMAAMRQS